MANKLKCAVALLFDKKGKYHGSVVFKEIKKGGALNVYTYVSKIPKGSYGFHIHEFGDMSNIWAEKPEERSIGGHYNPTNKKHGGRNDKNAHMGDLGNMDINMGTEAFSFGADNFKAKYLRLSGKHSILGRSVVLHKHEDDLGEGSFKDSKTSGHSGSILLAGIITIANCENYPV